jgi:CRISPR-associated protein Cmr4
MKSKLTFIHALSPLHAGTGQGVGVIDLPIAREKATNIPYLPGSSVKGSLRDEFNPPKDEKDAESEAEKKAIREQKDLRDRIFGPEKIDGNNGYAGAIQFTDQTLLCLPVRSLAGTFAYVTSPYILKRLKRDADLDSTFNPPNIPGDKKCVVASDVLIIVNNEICLEDLDLQANTDKDKVWANWLKDKIFTDSTWQQHFADRFCIVSDNVFSFFLNTATEVTARIKLQDDTKTTQQGALWYEESLPTESILFGLALAFPNNSTGLNETQIFKAVSDKLEKPLQFGGNATVGRGLCQVKLVDISASQTGTNSGAK